MLKTANMQMAVASKPPMQVVILAGGKGTRLKEKTSDWPKPLLQVGDKSLLEWIISSYSSQGYHEFLIPVGYLKNIVFEYFKRRTSEIRLVDKISGEIVSMKFQIGLDTITVIDTGEDTQTGGRLARLESYINGTFMLTYGDGLADVRFHELLNTHKSLETMVTLTAVHPQPRFGALSFDKYGRVTAFEEKGDFLRGWINGGFMVCEPELLDEIEDDNTNLEKDVLSYLTAGGKLGAHRHTGFWGCCDTLRDLEYLNQLYHEGNILWTIPT